jgi:hypothetical protein
VNVSPFWRGMRWAFAAAKVGYHWLVRDGWNIKFWEDQWFGGTSLAIHFSELYVICNEQTKTVSDIWDGQELKLSFRRCFNEKLLMQWEDLKIYCSPVKFEWGTGSVDLETTCIWGIYLSISLWCGELQRC